MGKRAVGRRRIKGRPIGRREHPVGRRVDAPLTAKERQHLAQLLICGGVFVLLVAVKLLLPETMAKIDQGLTGALERNMDVRTVFSVVGRAFSGEAEVGDAAEEVYQAVFHPEEGEVVRTSAPLLPEERTALETLQVCRVGLPMTEVRQPVMETTAYVLYSDQNLPASVSLEQAILGFDYRSPLQGAALSSGFGYREHPTVGEERFHYGIDLAADTGTAITCFADGQVTAVGESSSYGKYCIVDHEGGYTTLYAHCSRITAHAGTEVSGGEKIAEVGETGIATGPHLHFELQREGKYLNPIYYVSAL